MKGLINVVELVKQVRRLLGTLATAQTLLFLTYSNSEGEGEAKFVSSQCQSNKSSKLVLVALPPDLPWPRGSLCLCAMIVPER